MPQIQSDPIAPALDGVGALVASDRFAGAAMAVWNGGDLRAGCVGWRDKEAGLPIERDTIFRIASMTKPVTSVAAMMLLEEGKLSLDTPISRWAPEFARMRVLRSTAGSLDDTVAAHRPITIGDLLTHRSGLTYGGFWTGPLGRAYADALGGDIDSDVAPDDWIRRLAALPLIDQPGHTLHYGCSTDLLGLLIARMEEAPLGDVLARRIFQPLGMRDTGFMVRREHHPRRARLYGFDHSGRLIPRLTGPGGSTVDERPDTMSFVSGGQGLWSTVDDYVRFTRLFISGGSVDDIRLLRAETLALMTANHLTPDQRATAEVGGLPLFGAGHGFGLGVAVVLEPEQALPTICSGDAGTVGWPGGFGGWWQADPASGSVLVFLSHNVVEREQFASGIGFDVYTAITRFHEAATRFLISRAW
jgi:CubicO group peptidase (beta-lactamase class C family)